MAGKAGSPGNISGGPFSAKGDVEGKDVFPESISGETRLFPEVAEGGGSEGSGCSKAMLEKLSVEEQRRMSAGQEDIVNDACSVDARFFLEIGGVFPGINRGGAAVLTSEAGAAVAKVPQNTGMIGSGKGSLGAWFVGSRTALM